MSNRLVRGGLAWAAVAVLAAGCGSPDSDPGTASSNDPVEKQWQARTSVADCGAVQVGQGEEVVTSARAEVACLQEALDLGEAAELTVETPTSEGDPIITYYRVLPGQATEAYVDATRDKFGSGAWEFTSCDQPTSALDAGC